MQAETGAACASPQRRTLACHFGAGSVVDASGAQLPDGVPPLTVKFTPPHPLTLSTLQVEPMACVAGEQACVHIPSLKKLITAGPQVADTGSQAHVHSAGPASSDPVPAYTSVE